MKIYEHHELAPHTTMDIGGRARKYIEAESIDELIEVLNEAHEESAPVFILGAGSNTLISDEGFYGYVIHPAFSGVEWEAQEDGSTLVRIEAGANFDDVVAESCRRNLGGIESLSGIPGSAGGSIVQNIGAYGQEISECFVSAEAVHRIDRDRLTLRREHFAFGYRQTALKTPDNPFIIVSVTLRLTPFDAEKAAARCAEHGFKRIAMVRPETAQELRELVLETRRSKAMCYDKNDVNTHSVGSFFVNPVVPTVDAQRINAECIIKNHKQMPSYPADDGKTKLSAAWLIESSGFNKGYNHGGAGLSEYHCLAIVNRQNARCSEVVSFAQEIAQRVYLRFRVELHPEVVYLTPNGVSEMPLGTKEAEVTGMKLRPNPLFL